MEKQINHVLFFLTLGATPFQLYELYVVYNKKQSNINLKSFQSMKKNYYKHMSSQDQDQQYSVHATGEKRSLMEYISTIPKDNQNKKQQKWTEKEENLFVAFWIQYIQSHPYQSYSFKNAPLTRDSHSQQLSSYLRSKGDQHQLIIKKSPQVCKSKLNTIRQRIRREWDSGKRTRDFDFIDYFLEQASMISDPEFQLKAEIEQIEKMRTTQSKLMRITHQVYQLEISTQVKTKSVAIDNYLNLKRCQQPLRSKKHQCS